MIATHEQFPIKRLLLLVLMFIAATVTAQSNWQGTAVVGRFGEFPPGGLFASSNAFPLNTMVDVTNTTTGRTVRVVVVSRVSDSGVFMVLSDDAAEALQVSSGRGAVVRAEPVRLPGMTSVGPNQDLPFHRDPDINPAAGMGDPNRPFTNPLAAEIAALTLPEEEPEEELIVQDEPEAEPELDVLEQIAAVDTAPLEVLPADDSINDPLQQRLQELTDLLQEDQLTRVPEQAPPEAGLAPPQIPEIDLPMPILPVAALDQPEAPVVEAEEQVRPVEPVGLAQPIAVAPTHIPSDTELFLEPAEFRIPDLEPMEDLSQEVRDPPAPEDQPMVAEQPVALAEPVAPVPATPALPAIAAEPATLPATFPVVESLQRGAYYVQVAALTSEDSVRRAVDRLNGNVGLPVSVLPLPGQDRPVYRIVVGPLQADERGATLFLLRNQGFRDAFIRQE